MDSNHRRHSRRIYSPLHLAALQPTHAAKQTSSLRNCVAAAFIVLFLAFPQKWQAFSWIPDFAKQTSSLRNCVAAAFIVLFLAFPLGDGDSDGARTHDLQRDRLAF